MKKILLFFIPVLFIFNFANAETFDFSKNQNTEASEIMRDFIEQENQIYCSKASAVYFDIDNDSVDEIIGYDKSESLYSLKGYELVILKKEDRNWKHIKTNIYFNPEKPVSINKDKIKYQESDFYNNRKRSANISKNNIKTDKKFGGYKGNKIQKIENITKIQKNGTGVDINFEDIKANKQKRVNLEYDNLSDKVKHYFEMK